MAYHVEKPTTKFYDRHPSAEDQAPQISTLTFVGLLAAARRRANMPDNPPSAEDGV